MTFHVREPDSRLTPVFISNSVAISSVSIASVLVVFGWLSAYCEYRTTEQRCGSGQCDPCSIALIFGRKGPSQHPNDESNESKDSMVMILLTAVIAFSAIQTWLVYGQMRDHIKAVERAYIGVSHILPGFEGFTTGEPTSEVRIKFRIKNHGHTPVTVVGVSFGFVLGNLEAHPVPTRYTNEPQHAYLVPDAFFETGGFSVFDQNQIATARRGLFWLIVHVDYVDVFGGRHQTGYARRYAPGAAAGDNLVFETKPGYNYDTDVK